MPPAMPNLMYISLPPPMAPPAAPAPAPASPSSAAPPRALPAPAKTSSSSHQPLKCPMARTFYRSPALGEPPFIKVGDKVQKGQVVCIIEAMKLMNEIEADQSGTVTEILVEDGKPVSLDLVLKFQTSSVIDSSLHTTTYLPFMLLIAASSQSRDVKKPGYGSNTTSLEVKT